MTDNFEASWMPPYTIVKRQQIGLNIATTALVEGEFMEFEVKKSFKDKLEQEYNNGQSEN